MQWTNKKAYKETLLKLAGLFKKNFEVFVNHKIGKDDKLTEEILADGPILWSVMEGKDNELLVGAGKRIKNKRWNVAVIICHVQLKLSHDSCNICFFFHNLYLEMHSWQQSIPLHKLTWTKLKETSKYIKLKFLHNQRERERERDSTVQNHSRIEAVTDNYPTP